VTRKSSWGSLFVLAGTVSLLGAACSRDPKPAPAGSGATTLASAVPTTPPPPPVPPAPKRPAADLNVLLVSIDSLRADMPWNGYERPIAPRLTELVKTRGVQYTHAYSLSSYTSMSLGGFLGGKLPGELNRDGYFFGTYSTKNNLFFPEVLKAAKIRTVSAHAHGYFSRANFDQGFDAWEIVPNLIWNGQTDENSSGPQLEAIAEKLLSDPAMDAGRFFAWFHFLDPHDQYLSHPGIDWGKTTRDKYDGEVTYVDQAIGKLLDFVASKPWAGRTAIIITADHGEFFGEHSRYRHGFELWEPAVRVPLIFVLPDAKATGTPRKIDVPRGAIDMAPTILDLFGLPPTPEFEGKSLVPELYGAEPVPRDIGIDLPATSNNDRRRAFIHGKYKLIASGPTDAMLQVFDIEADPEEKIPVRGEAAAEVIRLYKDYVKTLKDVAPFGCKEDCLNGGYEKNKDGGAAP
jgi:arylsulfatase A-like enzyme